MTDVPQGLWLPPRTATLVVAASDSSDKSKAQADYVCDGTADQTEIQAAIDALPATGGKVVLLDGTFTLTAQIAPTISNVELMGSGRATILKCSSDHKAYYANALSGLKLSNLTIDANSVASIAVRFNASNDIIVDSLWFINPDNPASVPSVLCLSFATCYNFTVSHCHFAGGGATASASYDGVFMACYIMGTNSGHFIAKSASHAISFINCWSHSTYHAGIYIDEGSYDCQIIGGSYAAGAAGHGGVEVRGKQNVLAFIDVSESLGHGIILETMTGVGDVEDNLIIGVDAHGVVDGVRLKRSTGSDTLRRNKVLNCNLRSCSGVGIVEANDDTIVYDNTFLGNDTTGSATEITYQGEASKINSHEPVTTITVAATDADQDTRNQADYVCDGTADEVQIESAIAALPAGGGEIVLSEGTFTVDASIDITDSNITLRGQGRATIITTDTDNLDILKVTGASGSELTNVILRDFLVRGFETGNKNDLGIFWDYVDNSKIINVWSEHNGETGIWLKRCDNDEVENCHGFSNTDYGIYVSSSNFIRLINCICNSNTLMGIYVESGNDNDIIAPTCNNNDDGGSEFSGIDISSCDRVNIVGARCNANGLHGLYVHRSDYCSIIGGQFNNQTTGDGINITGDATENADYNIVNGACCTGNGDDGIAIEGTTDANKNIVIGCQLVGNSGTALVDNGTATDTGHNITA